MFLLVGGREEGRENRVDGKKIRKHRKFKKARRDLSLQDNYKVLENNLVTTRHDRHTPIKAHAQLAYTYMYLWK